MAQFWGTFPQNFGLPVLNQFKGDNLFREQKWATSCRRRWSTKRAGAASRSPSPRSRRRRCCCAACPSPEKRQSFANWSGTSDKTFKRRSRRRRRSALTFKALNAVERSWHFGTLGMRTTWGEDLKKAFQWRHFFKKWTTRPVWHFFKKWTTRPVWQDLAKLFSFWQLLGFIYYLVKIEPKGLCSWLSW